MDIAFGIFKSCKFVGHSFKNWVFDLVEFKKIKERKDKQKKTCFVFIIKGK